MEISGLRQASGASRAPLHLTLRQGRRLTPASCRRRVAISLQNRVINATTAERRGGMALSNCSSPRALFSFSTACDSCWRSSLSGLVRLQQRRQLIAAQGGGQPRAPGLRFGGYLRRGPAGLANSDCSWLNCAAVSPKVGGASSPGAASRRATRAASPPGAP